MFIILYNVEKIIKVNIIIYVLKCLILKKDMINSLEKFLSFWVSNGFVII